MGLGEGEMGVQGDEVWAWGRVWWVSKGMRCGVGGMRWVSKGVRWVSKGVRWVSEGKIRQRSGEK